MYKYIIMIALIILLDYTDIDLDYTDFIIRLHRLSS